MHFYSAENLVIRYRIKEYSPLLDSSNIGANEWIGMAEDIRVKLMFAFVCKTLFLFSG